MDVELRVVIRISFVLSYGEYLNRFRDIVVEHRGLNKKEYEKWHFHDRTHLRLAVFRVAFGHLYES